MVNIIHCNTRNISLLEVWNEICFTFMEVCRMDIVLYNTRVDHSSSLSRSSRVGESKGGHAVKSHSYKKSLIERVCITDHGTPLMLLIPFFRTFLKIFSSRKNMLKPFFSLTSLSLYDTIAL